MADNQYQKKKNEMEVKLAELAVRTEKFMLQQKIMSKQFKG